MHVIVFTAIEMEAVAIRRQLRRHDKAVVVHAVGLRASRLGQVHEPSAGTIIIVACLAGGLDPSLRVGDLVLDANESVAAPANCTRGRIHTSLEMIQSTDQKASLWKSTGAAAVDMEQSFVVDWAAKRGHSVIGLRAISDSAADALDPFLINLIDDLGRPRPMVIAKAILRRPARLLELIRLGRRSKLALANLSVAVAELLATLP